ncbi:MAG: lamin tail domain-containing protein, partial [Rhodothermales bacterium]|nr:lamin tail domain-containing protein [Rhodothermales bacterium]
MISVPSRSLVLAVFALIALLPGRVAGQASELFFSEYIEGSSNNKAVEVFNGTGSAVDLAAGGYDVQIFFNGSTSAGQTLALTGTVADGDVFVLANTASDAALLAVADQTSGGVQFNGDDAVVLRKAGVVIDVLGRVGEDPGSEWSGGGIGTQNETLRRKSTVCAGDLDGSDPFDPSTEWDGFPIDTFDGFGAHTADCGGGTTPDVVINEVDADTPGTDSAEFVELFGSPGLALDGLVLVLYNGNGDVAYDAFDLDGFTTDADGFFHLGNAAVVPTPSIIFSNNTLQNGADAVALYQGDAADFPSGTPVTDAGLIDALVYDTNDGDDAGLLAVLTPGQPRVNEDGNGAKDTEANARVPDGGAPFDTGSYVQQAPTPGASNVAAPAPQVVINEIDYDQDGTDDAEFVELYNAGSATVDLTGYTLEFVNGTGGGAALYDTIVLPAVSLPPGGFYVVCANAATVPGCDLDDGPDTNFIQNGAPDAVGLRDALGALVDAVSYEGDTGAPYTEGSGAGLQDDPSVDFAGIARFPDGTDTDQNNADLSLRCISPGAANLAASSGCTDPGATPDVVINEVDADTPGTDSAEFVELFGTPGLALDGLVLVLYNGNGDVAYDAFDLDGQTTDAGGYFVLCGDAANVPNCDLDVSPNTNLIQNGADAVALY